MIGTRVFSKKSGYAFLGYRITCDTPGLIETPGNFDGNS
jgi:hypothetical protein